MEGRPCHPGPSFDVNRVIFLTVCATTAFVTTLQCRFSSTVFRPSRNRSCPAIASRLPANRLNAGVWTLRTAVRSAARPASARVALKFFCAATDVGQQTFDRAVRLGASTEPDRPKIAAQVNLGDSDFA